MLETEPRSSARVVVLLTSESSLLIQVYYYYNLDMKYPQNSSAEGLVLNVVFRCGALEKWMNYEGSELIISWYY